MGDRNGNEEEEKLGTISRREFLRDAGLVVGGVSIGSVVLSACKRGGGTGTETETATKTSTSTLTAPGVSVTVTNPPITKIVETKPQGFITLKVNGKNYQITGVKPEYPLSWVLREKLGLYSIKVGCERGECGSCSVIVDGTLVYSCILLAIECEGKDILTLEGLSDGTSLAKLSPVQLAFYNNDAHQCGYCTPGLIMATKALLDKNTNPSRDEIREALSGNLCTCGGTHKQVINTILSMGGK